MNEHSRFDLREPAEETIIWKYLDLAKYLALLKTRQLHLAPATEFWDKYEGDIARAQKKSLLEKYGQDQYESLVQSFDKLRERTYVSCWTENEFESDAMWRIYTGASYGVAIESTYGRLRALLPRANREQQRGLAQFCGSINYIDFKSEILEQDCYKLAYFFKRKSFEHEREGRVVVHDMRGDQAEGPRKIQLTQAQIDSLIVKVHLSPGAPSWFKDLVYEVNKDYGLDREPIPSALDEAPE